MFSLLWMTLLGTADAAGISHRHSLSYISQGLHLGNISAAEDSLQAAGLGMPDLGLVVGAGLQQQWGRAMAGFRGSRGYGLGGFGPMGEASLQERLLTLNVGLVLESSRRSLIYLFGAGTVIDGRMVLDNSSPADLSMGHGLQIAAGQKAEVTSRSQQAELGIAFVRTHYGAESAGIMQGVELGLLVPIASTDWTQDGAAGWMARTDAVTGVVRINVGLGSVQDTRRRRPHPPAR